MKNKAVLIIISFSLSLMLVLVVIRTKVLEMSYLYTFTSTKSLIRLITASHYDIIFVIAVTSLFFFVAFIYRKRPKILSLLAGLFISQAIFNIFINLANVKVVQLLGVPFNYQWLYYSDILGNSEALSAIDENLSFQFFVYFFLLVLLLLAIGIVLNISLKKISAYQLIDRKVFLFTSLGFIFYLIVANFNAQRVKMKYSKMANPVVAFAESMVSSYLFTNDLFSVELPDNFEAFPVRHNSPHSPYNSPNHKKVRNIIFFVLESVSSKYVSGYTDSLDVTPVIKKHLNQSLIFSDIYAHSPSTNNTLVSLLGSVYPMISYKSISSEKPNIDWPTISDELKKNDYSTGFFFSSDLKFKKMNEFLASRQFDVVADYKDISCSKETFSTQWENLDGVDEECMVDSFSKWLTSINTEKPFFASLWTMQTHYPYFASPPLTKFSNTDTLFNRYLNALHHSDAMLGKVMDILREKDLDEKTLVVVLGDHGEAFLQHYQYGHASHIYEENINIPLIFINPLLFSGEKKKVIGGHIDIAPTIMDILNLKSPPEWQGISLFDPSRTNRAYFFSPWSEYLFGYRTPEYKVIYNASTDQTQLYNLNTDPYESHNIANQNPEEVELSYKRLARWVQYHSSYLNESLLE